MFNGIIQRIGEVRSARQVSGGLSLVVRAEGFWRGVATGASVAVDGACLTLTQANEQDATFDVIGETVRRTTIGRLGPGARVNLQKAMAMGDAVDGHFVQGHIDAVARVSAIEQAGGESIWWFEMDRAATAYVIPKGSVAIDGISLTVAGVKDGRFSVALIPTTLKETTLGQKRTGDEVNVETDILARTVVHYLQSMAAKPGSTGSLADLLKEHGFGG